MSNIWGLKSNIKFGNTNVPLLPKPTTPVLILGIEHPTVQSSVNAITISWEKPFTTDLEFCVDAKSIGSSIAMVCVDDTQYTFTSLDSDVCEELSFTVTPTDRMRNGTASPPVTQYFQRRRGIMVLAVEFFILCCPV